MQVRRPPMHFVAWLTLLVLVNACATAKTEHTATMADTGWIQKGFTTRSQIEARFGSPSFEVPEYPGSTRATTATATPRIDEATQKSPGTVTESPKETKATYLLRRSETAIAPSSADLQEQDDRFWVTYDANNVVKDFGFAGPPATRLAAPTNARQ